MASRKKQHLLDVATGLFYARGFHATGIDTIIAKAGIAKMTLYNNFASKDALIEACLHQKSLRVMDWMKEGADAAAGTGRNRLLSMFDLHEAWFASKAFRGCIFAKAAGEFPDRTHASNVAAAVHFRSLFDFLARLAAEARVEDATTLAEQMVLLLEGATTLAGTTGATIAARRAKRTMIALMH
jgi:AcrR family transcriptional regulator